ncbi:hypothetical protein [Mangrovibacterium sp.]|uniref:hypothetical protein n=1 Tax=Mangrovibacterium sp. TaxID=1961364 RepID=UPI00356140F4
MKKVVLIVLFLLIISPFIMWLLWFYGEKKEMDVFILDKTVLTQHGQEHLSLNWVLKHHKYVKNDGDFYSAKDDYYGFFPDGKGGFTTEDLEQKTDNELDLLADRFDMAYYTDLYGIYWNEWLNEYPSIKPEEKAGRLGERSSLMYGGLSENELVFLTKMKDRKKLIINEFNIVASPTPYRLREKWEEEFHVKWSGWVGRYFGRLDTVANRDLPPWLIRNYMEQNNNEWPFTKSGIVFVRQDDRIVILEDETHLENEVPVIYTGRQYASYYKLADKIKYPFWFDICSTDSVNQIVANYRIEHNQKGDSILRRWHIPAEFPAVIKRKADYPFYYFAGDFADNPISMSKAKFKYIDSIESMFYSKNISERHSFFWRYYRPLVSRIVDDYYQTLEYRR